MKNILVLLLLMFSIRMLGSEQSAPAEFLQALAQSQQKSHSAIGWVDAGRLEFIVFSNKPAMQDHVLPGPPLWAASVHAASGQVFGGLKTNGKRTFVALTDGKVLWENPDLISQDAPEVSPSGKVLILKARDKKTGADGLLLVENQGQKITQISRDGKNPSWFSADSRFVYEENGEIVVYDLRSQRKQRVGVGTSPSWSPDGKWITYKTAKNQFVLADASGEVQRTLVEGGGVLTRLYWSPDSDYLMYVRKSKVSGSLNCPDAKDVVAYRLGDGQSAAVYRVCEGYPFWMLRWVQLPSNVSLSLMGN